MAWLRVAQPALSRQIRDLENELGTRLLDRNRVRVQLTDAGRTFYAHTCKILAQVDIAVASVNEAVAGTSGEFIICNDWRLSNRFVLGTIAEFRTRFPRVEVTLRDLHIHEQLTALRTRRAHLGFVIAREFAANDDLESLNLLTAQLLVAVGANHRLSSGEDSAGGTRPGGNRLWRVPAAGLSRDRVLESAGAIAALRFSAARPAGRVA